MAEMEKPARRKNRMEVRKAQAKMRALLPEIEALIVRFGEIGEELEAAPGSDELAFGRPGRESLRYRTAINSQYTAELLTEALENARKGARRTHADLVARWEEEQKAKREQELERYRDGWSLNGIAVGG
jgi:hypothetical protein